MADDPSEFYPPRAGGLAWLRPAWYRFRKALNAERLTPPEGVWTICAGILIPGIGLHSVGLHSLSRLIMASYGLALLIFLAGLGYSIATLALVAMIFMHVTSVCYLQRRFFPETVLSTRITFALGMLLLVSLGLYWPARIVTEKIILPLHTPAGVVVVNSRASSAQIRTGDAVAFRVAPLSGRFDNGTDHGAVIVEAGYGFGAVLGLSGDVIQFTPTNYFINGQPRRREKAMPETGQFTIPPKSWFLWPDFAIYGNGRAAQMQAEELFRALGVVAQTNFVGRPFQRWFFRRQRV
jgi:hypothetical protein